MSNPTYKGPGQPMPSTNDGVTGWLGGFLGGATAPPYKPAPTAPPPPPCPPCKPAPTKPAPTQAPTTQTGDACDLPPEVFLLDPCEDDAVIPVGNGPITIVIQPRA